MTAAIAEQYDEDGQVNLAGCAYFQRVGSCSFGCWEEPSCETDCPREGWPALDLHPMHEQNLRARRLAYRMRNWIGWITLRPYPEHLKTYVSEFAYKPPSKHAVLRWMNTGDES